MITPVRGDVDNITWRDNHVIFYRRQQELARIPVAVWDSDVAAVNMPFEQICPDVSMKRRARLARMIRQRMRQRTIRARAFYFRLAGLFNLESEYRRAQSEGIQSETRLSQMIADALVRYGEKYQPDALGVQVSASDRGDGWVIKDDTGREYTASDEDTFRLIQRVVDSMSAAYRSAIRDEIMLQRCVHPAAPADVASLRARLRRWQAGGLRLQCLDNSGSHRLDAAGATGKLIALAAGKVISARGEFTNQNYVPFVVQHDWHAALRTAVEFEGGRVPLPFDRTAVEFRISGRHVIADFDAQRFTIFVEMEDDSWAEPISVWQRASDEWDWATDSKYAQCDADFAPLVRFVLDETRALFIALDAEAATTDVIRAPEKLNRKRIGRGQPPLRDYHVVRLDRRTRAAPIEGEHEHEARRRPRLHFVRGHWRHYLDHKTWIKWHFRGDPDLGFIDKEYRL